MSKLHNSDHNDLRSSVKISCLPPDFNIKLIKTIINEATSGLNLNSILLNISVKKWGAYINLRGDKTAKDLVKCLFFKFRSFSSGFQLFVFSILSATIIIDLSNSFKMPEII